MRTGPLNGTARDVDSDELSDTQFTVEEIAVAVQEARARGSYVTVHAHNDEAIRNAVKAGVRCVEIGKRADIVLFHGNPLDDPTIFADHDRVGLVMQNGRVVKQRG